MAVVVPGTLIGLAAVALYPLVFVPLVVLVGVALVVAVGNEGTRRNPCLLARRVPRRALKAVGWPPPRSSLEAGGRLTGGRSRRGDEPVPPAVQTRQVGSRGVGPYRIFGVFVHSTWAMLSLVV